MPLNYFAQLASNILSNNTKYQKDKEIIKSIFTDTLNNNNKVIARLSTIDGFYSTQMNKRFWGIEEISEAINNISTDDDTIINLANQFINNTQTDNPIYNLIVDNYGYKKNGRVYGRASSLVTKYLYFVTGFQFPIYDSLIRSSYESISSRLPQNRLPVLSNSCGIVFFNAIKMLSSVSEINDFDILDNLLWLYGKIREGSFSLILQKDVYLTLVDNVMTNHLDISIDNAIREYLQNQANDEQIINSLGNDLRNFCVFCFNHNNAI